MELELAEIWVMVFPFLLKDGGVPYPGYFAKCAEALEFKRVGGNICSQV
jgi:hypothetical protein